MFDDGIYKKKIQLEREKNYIWSKVFLSFYCAF